MKIRVCLTIACAACAWSLSAAQTAVRGLRLLDSKDAVEIEVEASDRVTPEIQALTNPERLVVDFPNALPGPQLRNLPVHRGQVKGVRVGLFQAKPPVTRLVVDLSAAQAYRVFPYGRTVIIKVESANSQSSTGQSLTGQSSIGQASSDESSTEVQTVALQQTSAAAPAQTATPPAHPALEVTYENGLLAIHADKASLSEVLEAVHQRTGAQVELAPGAEQEKVVVDLAPGPAPEVLGHLLNGSKFNFLIVSAANDPNQLQKVILTQRPETGPEPLAPVNPPPANPEKTDDTDENQTPPRSEAVPPPPDPAPIHANPPPPPQ